MGTQGDCQVHGLSKWAYGGAFYCDSACGRNGSGVRVG